MDFYRICRKIQKRRREKHDKEKLYFPGSGTDGSVPLSALRCWEKQDFLHFPEKGKMDIRLLRICTQMIEISEVLFYRSLSLPLEDIRKIPDLEGEELEALLEQESGEIAEKDTGTGAVAEKN